MSAQGPAPGQKQRVLYVNSYHPGYTWSDQILEGLNGRLKPAFGERVDLQVEFLDGKRYSSELEGPLGSVLLSFFRAKYAETRFDLLLVSDQDAYNFMRKARKDVFPDVPMIFAGVEQPGDLASHTTGILASTDIRGNIDLIRQVLPAVKRIVVLSDNSVTGQINRALFQKENADLASRCEFLFLGTKPDEVPEKILEAVTRLQPSTDAVFFLDYYSSSSGPVNPAIFIKALTSASRAPVFSHVDLYINYGILAGKMNSGLLQGRQMADIAIGVLRGASIAHLAPQMEVSVPTADYSALARFSIEAARFPEGTRFLNKSENILSRYRWHITVILGFLLLLAVLIVILVFLLRRQKLLEIHARRSAAHFQMLFQNAPVPVACYSTSGKSIGVNDQLTKTLGYTLEDLPDIDAWWQCAYPDPDYRRKNIEAWSAVIEKSRETGEKIQTAEYSIACKDGSIKSLCLSACILEDRIIVSFFDVTDQKRTEEELRNSEENLRITLNSIGDAVIATDTQGVVTRMNPVAEKLTGWGMTEAVGRKLHDVFNNFTADDRKPVQSPVENVVATGKKFGLASHTVLRARNGKEYQIADSGAPILADSGEIVGAILVFHDVTEEYTLQAQLAQSQKMDAIGQLAGGVAHDFNNILSGVMGAAELLKSRIAPDDATSRKYVSLILASSQRAAELTRQLLTFSRKKQAISTVVDVHAAIDDVIALLEKTIDKRISITRNFAEEKALAIGDGSLIRSALINLGINSVHAMPEGGSLVYATKIVQISETIDETGEFELVPGRFLQVIVCDTGCGIPPENLKRVFEPFFTTKEPGKGTGLGLAAVYGTIRQHKGAISITSQVGKGTSVKILLPSAGFEIPGLSAMKEPVRGTGTILLVDDEPIIRATGRAILEQFGYQVLLAENGREAVRVYRENNRRIDLVILDMIMPDMNGRDCFYELKRIRPDVKVLLASGFSKEEDLSEMREQGLAGFISKPYQGAELSQKIAELTRHR